MNAHNEIRNIDAPAIDRGEEQPPVEDQRTYNMGVALTIGTLTVIFFAVIAAALVILE